MTTLLLHKNIYIYIKQYPQNLSQYTAENSDSFISLLAAS